MLNIFPALEEKPCLEKRLDGKTLIILPKQDLLAFSVCFLVSYLFKMEQKVGFFFNNVCAMTVHSQKMNVALVRFGHFSFSACGPGARCEQGAGKLTC